MVSRDNLILTLQILVPVSLLLWALPLFIFPWVSLVIQFGWGLVFPHYFVLTYYDLAWLLYLCSYLGFNVWTVLKVMRNVRVK